jgi:hypothetical protein
LLAAALSPIAVRPIVGKNWEAEAWIYLAIFSIVTIFSFWRRALGFVEVGADGVAIRKGIRKKFHFYRDIKYISRDPQVGPLGSFILIGLAGGGEISLRIDTMAGADQEIFVRRLHEEFTAYWQASKEGRDVGALLDRGGQPFETWKASIERASRGAVQYRSAQIGEDLVLRTMKNPTERRDRRMGAAISLAAKGDPALTEKIRLAAGESADPKLRIALEKIADGNADEAAIEEAMAVEEAAEKTRKS